MTPSAQAVKRRRPSDHDRVLTLNSKRLHSPKQELMNSMQASSDAGEVMKQPASRHYGFAQPAVVDLKRKSVMGESLPCRRKV